MAFQLTNILRDLREDAALGRTYLPADELAAAGVTAQDLRSLRGGETFRELMRRQIARAEEYYEKSARPGKPHRARLPPHPHRHDRDLPRPAEQGRRRTRARPPRARLPVPFQQAPHRLAGNAGALTHRCVSFQKLIVPDQFTTSPSGGGHDRAGTSPSTFSAVIAHRFLAPTVLCVRGCRSLLAWPCPFQNSTSLEI